jgi:hypothetical protein
MYCLLTVIFTWLVFESSYVGLYYVRKSHVILMCAFVTYCLVAAWCELTYGALRCEICLSFTVLVSAVVLFSRKIHPTLRSAHVGTGTGTQYTASLPLCYRYCDSYNPHASASILILRIAIPAPYQYRFYLLISAWLVLYLLPPPPQFLLLCWFEIHWEGS